MDYDDNDNKCKNLQLAGEGRSKSISLLRPYAFPKFDFDDSLQGHLRFDSLVETEVFLGIQGQEDNQWIEDFSRGSSSIGFSSVATDSCSIHRQNNVWSEATSSESVEMLLKSVGHEQTIPGKTIIEESNICGRSGSLVSQMETNCSQDIRNDEYVTSLDVAVRQDDLQKDIPELKGYLEVEPLETEKTPVSQENIASTPDKLGHLGPDESTDKDDPSVTEGHRHVAGDFEDKSGGGAEIPGNESPDHKTAKDSSVGHFEDKGRGGAGNPVNESLVHNTAEDLSAVSVANMNSVQILGSSDTSKLANDLIPGVTDCVPTEITDCGINHRESSSTVQTGIEIFDCSTGNSSNQTLESLVCFTSKSDCINVRKNIETSAEPVKGLLPSPGLEESDKDGCRSPTQTSKDVAMVLPANKDSYPLRKDNYENSPVNSDVQQTPVLSSINVAECATTETMDSNTQQVASQVSSRRDDVPEGSLREVCLASDTVSEPSSHVGNDQEHSIDKGESLHNVHSVISPERVALSTSVELFREKVETETETETRSDGLDASEVVTGKSSYNDNLLNSVLVPSGEVLLEKKAFGQDDTSESILDISTVKNDKEASENLSVNVKDMGSEKIGTSSKDQKSELPALSEGNTDNEVTFHGLQPELSTPEESANAVLPSAKIIAPATVDSHAEGGERTSCWKGLVRPDKNETAANISTDNGLADMVGSDKVANDVTSGFGDKVHCSHDSLPSSSDITGKTSAISVSCNVTSEVGSPTIVAVSSGAHCPKEAEVRLSCSESVLKVGDAAEAVLPGNDDKSAVKIGCDTMSLHGADSNTSGSGSPTIISSSELCQNHSANQETGKYEGSETLGKKTQLSKKNLKVKDGSGDDSSFSFKVNSLPDSSERENGNNWSPFTSIVTSTSSPVVEVSTPSRLEKTDSELPHTNFFSSPKVGEVELAYGTPKSNPDRRGRRSSTKGSGKEKTRKATRAKETTPNKPPGHVEKVSNDISSPFCTTPHAFQQPFTDMQQVQLRAQIFVYGSIIQGAVPEEACMVSAFGPSDAGRRSWEPLWRAAAERIRNQKFASSAETPLQGQPQSGSNAPDLAGISGPQNILLSSPVSRASSKAAPATVMSPIIPMSSPLWSMTTPSRDGLQSALLQRVPLVDYQHALSPVHPYQTPSVRNVVGPTSWSSQGPSPVSWTSHTSSFLTSPRFSARPMMETVNLTPVRESVVSVTPVSKHLTCSPVAHTIGPSNLVSGTSEQFDPKKQISSLKKSANPKPRKRKKAPASDDPGQGSPLPSAQTEPVFASLTNSSMFATSSPYLSKINVSKSVNDASPVDSIVHVKKGDTEVVKAITCSDEVLTTIAETRNVVAPATLVSGISEQFDPNKKISSPKQQSADPRTRKRKKVPASDDPGQVSVPASAQTEPVFASLTSSSLVATSRPCLSKTDVSKLPNEASPVDHILHIKKGVTEAGKAITCSDEALTKVAESKSLAEDAAVLAAAATNQCQEVWNKLANQQEAGLTSETEAQLASTAVAIAAAASVAKAAAAAADVASNAALQAKLMADEALLSSRQGNSSQSDLHTIGMATPTTILKGDNGSNQSHSILVVAREAARRRLEAASAASKQAENLDAIVRAAELAVDAVSQAGKIVAMGNPMTLNELIKSGPEGYWKLSQPSSELAAQPCDVGDVKESVDKSPKVSGGSLSPAGGLQMNHDKTSPLTEVSSESRDKCTRAADKNPGTAGAGEKEMRDLKSCKTSEIDTPDEVVPPEVESEMAIVQEEHDGCTGGCEESCFKEGFRVEVFKDGNGFKAGWFSADVLTINDGKAYVCFVDVLSDEGSRNLKEWVPLEGEGGIAPRIRNVHPHSEGTKKRRRSAMGDYAWAVGDRVDAWIQDSWWEGVVKEKQEKDDTALIVEFPAQGEVSTLKAWQLRPSRIWSDGKWVVWSRLRECSSSYKGDTPKEKRQRVGSPPAASGVDKMSGGDHPVTGKTEVSRLLPLSASDKVFNVGKPAREVNKPGPRRPFRTGSQKEGSRVVFGVPKPGRKQKFMEVSKQYSEDRGRKKSEANDTAKSATYLVPQATSRGWKNPSNTMSKEKQAADKPIAASSRRSQNVGRSTSRRAHNPTVVSRSDAEPGHSVDAEDSVSHNDSASDKPGRPDHASSSGAEEADGPLSSMFAHRSEGTSKKASTSNPQAQRLNKGKVGRGGKLTKIEESKAYNENSGKSMFEAVEPRRSNRRFQPTHRLLEGLQTSMLIPKMPSASHDKGHKSQNNSSGGGN